MIAIKTEYRRPSLFSREAIVATAPSGQRLTLPYPTQLSYEEAHEHAAIFFGFIEEAAAIFFSGYLHDEITLTKAAVKRIKKAAIGETLFQIRHDEDHKVVLEHFIARQKNEAIAAAKAKGLELMEKAENMRRLAGCNRATNSRNARVKNMMIGRADALEVKARELMNG